jgi:hypothetical protein
MYWAKHHFARLREIDSQSIHACNHVLAMNCLYYLQGNQPVIEVWMVWSWGWFAVAAGSWCSDDYSGCLPFSSLIRSWLACPSPPWSASGGLPSPPGQGLLHLALIFSFYGSIHGVYWMVFWCVLVLGARTVVFLCWSSVGRVGAASSSRAHLLQLLARLIVVVLPAASFSLMTELLVSS